MEAESRNSLSNFPDAILLHIVSFLEVKDIALLGAVSRRFQTLSISTPSFSFPYSPRFPNIIPDKNCLCLHFFNYMSNLPQQRPHDLKIDRLSFSSSCMKRKHRKLHKQWLNKLFQAFHVDELSIDCELHSIFTNLSSFQSLKVLKLKMSLGVFVKLPDMKLASLERLHMEWIETEDSVGGWLSQSFPSLKSLLLFRVHMSLLSRKRSELTIQSSSLEDLTIDHCCSFKLVRIITHNLRALSYTNCMTQHCGHEGLNVDEIVVEVSAPNLQSLEWVGAPRRLCYDKETFKNLHVATINTGFHDLNLVKQLFEAIRSTGILRMDSISLEDLYGKPFISFGNVRHLETIVYATFCKDNVCDVLSTCLERISNLETLTLVSYNCGTEVACVPFSLKYALRECRETKWKKIKGLKKVKFIIRYMYHSIAFLMGMLMKSCVDMEEMTLIYPSRCHRIIEVYLNCLESASSALSINLNPPSGKRCRSQYNSLDSNLKKPSQLRYRDGDNHAEKIMSSYAEGDTTEGSLGASSKKARLIEQ